MVRSQKTSVKETRDNLPNYAENQTTNWSAWNQTSEMRKVVMCMNGVHDPLRKRWDKIN